MEVDKVQERFTAAAGWERLEQFFYEQWRGGATLTPAHILAWSEAGHPAADRALRRYAAEMIDHGRESELLLQVKGYIVKAMLKPFVPYPRGRHVAMNMMR